MRILLINSLKNTARGKVLLGCRRRGSALSIEILDTGLGIPDGQLKPLLAGKDPFDGTAAERSRGIGISLAQRLCSLLGHRLDVTSSLGTGTLFKVEVPLLKSDATLTKKSWMQGPLMAANAGTRLTGTILVIEDDRKTHELLELLLKEEGHTVATARDEIAALEMVARGSIRPDLILADDRLLRHTGQHQITRKLEEKLLRQIPLIVLISDAYMGGVRELESLNCVRLNKPVRAAELTQTIQRLLPPQDSALEQGFDLEDLTASREFAIDRMKHLTERQRQIMERVLAGDPSKNIAMDLGISRRTVENHRAEIMRKTGARSIPELARMALAAARRNQD
jgi:two-component system CheB/CheR fusion protein